MSSSLDELANLRIPYENILSATNNFADENLIKRGRASTVYEGKLLWLGELTDVAVRRFDPACGLNRDEFLRQIQVLSQYNHKNIISIVGICDENDENIIIMGHVVNGSLDQHLSDPTLTWSQRLKICLGAGAAFSEIHTVMKTTHGDIRCSKILLDSNWEAKVSCFGLSTENHGLLFHDWSDGFMEEGTKKSDVCFFGVILFEVLCGRRSAFIGGDESVAAMAKRHYTPETLESTIDPDLKNQIHPLSFKLFSQIAYECLEEEASMYDIYNRLDDALEVQLKHEYIEQHLVHLKIPLSGKELIADNYFYSHFDSKSSLTVEVSDRSEPPKRQIKRISYEKQSRAKDFFADFEMLTTCEHPNIVSIMGFSWEDSDMILVYEYPLKGSLCDYLGSTIKRNSLTWERRLQISLDIAHGLHYLHNNMKEKPGIVDRGIESQSIFLDDKWNAKIVSMKLAKKYSGAHITEDNKESDIHDFPEKESDIYLFGLVLFEILFGWLADDPRYKERYAEGLAPFALGCCFDEGRLITGMVDPVILEEALDDVHGLRIGANQDSLDAFAATAYLCVAKTKCKRPTMEFIIEVLDKALRFEDFSTLKIQFEDIVLATKNFAKENCIGSGGYGEVYKAGLNILNSENSLPIERKGNEELHNKNNIVAIKRIKHREDGKGKKGFLAELKVLIRCKHPNIVSLLRYCMKGPNMILVYEHATYGSLDNYLETKDNKINLTWSQRIKMCLDIAYGLKYLHKSMLEKQMIIHRDIKSANILLFNNWKAKIADFGLSKVHPTNQLGSTINTNYIAGTSVYMDPEYMKTGNLKKESDIYSFGIVLFEVLSGKLAYDSIHWVDNNIKGLVPIARQHFNKGTLKQMVDPKIMEEAHEFFATLKIGASKDSLDTFSKIAYQCLAETQAARPTIDVIIEELQNALNYQEHRKDFFKIPFEDIELGTKNFHEEKCIITGGDWDVYKGEIDQCDKSCMTVFVKRLRKSSQEDAFLAELEILYKHKHKNIIGIVGYCKERDEKIIVYEYASKGSLDKYLNKVSLGWRKRLKICIDVAVGLCFLHEGVGKEEMVIHGDIKSSSILLTGNWKGKISDFGHSLITPVSKNMDFVVDDFISTPGNCEYSLNREMSIQSKESDIYAIGVVLFEILCGRPLMSENYNATDQYLDNFVKKCIEDGKLDEHVLKGMEKQIHRKSLETFGRIAYQCLQKKSPTAREVVVQLRKALEIQEDYEIWEAKLPHNCEEIIKKSVTTETYTHRSKKDIYNMLFKGILLKKDKMLWFSLGNNGERNEMISAKRFSYIKRFLPKWQSIPESRFPKVAEMFYISNLKTRMKIKTQFLSPPANYKVHLIFRFSGTRKSLAGRMYVNLKYKMGDENLHSYFATWIDDEWMMIELFQFFRDKEGPDFEVLIESFSRSYCGNPSIYIEGVQLQAIENVKHEKLEKLKDVKQVLKLKPKTDKLQFAPSKMKVKNYHMAWFSLVQIKRNRDQMLSGKEVVYNSSNLTTESRFRGAIEFLGQPVFRIKCKIKSQMLFANTKNVCYLVFRISKECRGLHGPVMVRDLFDWRNKEMGILYFRFPSPWNLHDTDWVPKKRKDGWMEVIVWKFNKDYVLKSDCLFVNLKFTAYEGTMSGLIVRGIEFRPIK